MSAAPLPVPSGSAGPVESVLVTQRRPGRRGRALLSLVPPPVRARRAQDAFRLHALQSQSAALSEQKEALSSNTDGLNDPAQLAKRAAQLGMVDGETPLFLTPGQPLPQGAIRLGDLAYIPGPPVRPKPASTPTAPVAEPSQTNAGGG